MTILEVCAELRKETKPYIGIMTQPQFSNTLFAIEVGRAKPSTTKSFFNKFGYDGEFNEWHHKTLVPGRSVYIRIKTKEEIESAKCFSKENFEPIKESEVK